MQIYLIFYLINVSNKHSSWDWDQIGIKFGTDYIIYQKLAILSEGNIFYEDVSEGNKIKVYFD